ncbi:MAG TPA: ATP-binding SpoIIE family protein phosphatase, partial [Kineosporiaceae bacterium]|nr:ATP-binding SpoIIE family protein phosphatase [Kineosporiaceae bacterium]
VMGRVEGCEIEDPEIGGPEIDDPGIEGHDAAGHDSTAAAVMADVRGALCAQAAQGHGPAEIMNRVNRHVVRHTRRRISCCYAELRPAELSLTCVSAGHPLPVVLCPDGFLRPVPIDPEPPLGSDRDAGYTQHYTEQCILLPAGSTVLLVTAGLVDDLPGAVHPGPALLAGDGGIAGVVRDQAEQPVEDLADGLISRPVSPAAARDGVALLAVRLTAAARGTQSAGLEGQDGQNGGDGQDGHQVEQVYRMFGPTPQTTPAARRFVLDVLLGWGMTDLENTAALAVSELVTNVVVHTSSPVHLTMRRIGDTGVWIGVRDDSDRLPQPRQSAVDEIAGRGLAIVDQLADTWGVQRPLDHGGKTVWLELSSSAEPTHAQP